MSIGPEKWGQIPPSVLKTASALLMAISTEPSVRYYSSGHRNHSKDSINE